MDRWGHQIRHRNLLIAELDQDRDPAWIRQKDLDQAAAKSGGACHSNATKERCPSWVLDEESALLTWAAEHPLQARSARRQPFAIALAVSTTAWSRWRHKPNGHCVDNSHHHRLAIAKEEKRPRRDRDRNTKPKTNHACHATSANRRVKHQYQYRESDKRHRHSARPRVD